MTATVVTDIPVPVRLIGGVLAGYAVSAAGVINTGPSYVAKLTCQVAGSITLNDCSTTGGASITNQIIAVTMAAGAVLTLSWPCLLGIVASSVGGGGVFSIAFT